MSKIFRVLFGIGEMFPSLLAHFQTLLPGNLSELVSIAPSTNVDLEVICNNIHVKGRGDAIVVPNRYGVEGGPKLDLKEGCPPDAQSLLSRSALCFIEWKAPSQMMKGASARQCMIYRMH